MKEGINIARPIATFNQLDDYSFASIYLDEGDDPQPWNCSTHSAYNSDDEIIWKTPFKSFFEPVNTMVEQTISGFNA
ncbi:MAG: hypothetical protein MK078_02770 [Crocinitomicaceae bacterium]|nr:hypothetical protein [Crocinitomicaceae bacterium]